MKTGNIMKTGTPSIVYCRRAPGRVLTGPGPLLPFHLPVSESIHLESGTNGVLSCSYGSCIAVTPLEVVSSSIKVLHSNRNGCMGCYQCSAFATRRLALRLRPYSSCQCRMPHACVSPLSLHMNKTKMGSLSFLCFIVSPVFSIQGQT